MTSTPATRVDAHHHVWDLQVRPEPWIDPVAMSAIDRSFSIEDLRGPASRTGIGATIVVQTVSSLDETREFLALADTDPLVAAVTGWVDLTAPDVADTLAELRAAAGGEYLRGVRHQVQDEPDQQWLRRTDVRAGLAAIAAADYQYELLTLPDHLPAAVETVAELDELEFVLDHCSKPPIATGELEPWAEWFRRLAGMPNVTCKLSGLITEADWNGWTVEALRPYVEVALEAFGPDRLMFGSDWPVCLLAGSYPQWVDAVEALTADLSAHERDAIWGGTARRVYRLDTSG